MGAGGGCTGLSAKRDSLVKLSPVLSRIPHPSFVIPVFPCSTSLDTEVRMERDRIAQEVKAKLSRGRFARPRSPAWTVGEDLVTVSTPSGRAVSRCVPHAPAG